MGRRIAVVGLSLALLLVGGGILTAMAAGGGLGAALAGGSLRTEVAEQVFTVAGTPTFSLAGGNGSVVITRGDDRTVRVRATKRAANDEALRRLQVTITQNGDAVAVQETNPPLHFAFGFPAGVEYEVQLPARAVVASVRTSNGRVELSGIVGTVDVGTVNGTVMVRDFDGMLTVQTTNGRVMLTNGRGAVRVGSTNGSLDVQNVQAAGLSLRTVNGRVGFAGSLATGSDNRIETTNGAVTVRLLPESAFALDAQTVSGSVTVDFPLTMTNGRQERNAVRGMVMRPDATLTVRAVSGSITIGAGSISQLTPPAAPRGAAGDTPNGKQG